ncbi:MAG: protein-disulfide reductase DsbD N-terminal domain-containing protein [Acidobacteria bacterium]|nr:protein-disulfide reductase DsbD N-terminal domain-containing protein [Acidobacteriota bacterium]
MRRKNYLRFALLSSLALSLFIFPANFYADGHTPERALDSAEPVTAPAQPTISVSGFFAADKAQRGCTVQAAVVMEIPRDFHVNSNRPGGKYVKATALKVSAVSGIKIGPVTYPRAVVRKFSFSEEQLSVFEGRVVMRFTVTVPSDFQQGVTQITARLFYQSCSNEVCFQPETRSISMPIAIVGPEDSVKRINGNIFGRRG